MGILRFCIRLSGEMMLRIFWQLSMVALLCTGWEVACLPLPSQTVVDLTHAMGDSAITWPSNDPFAVTKVFRDRVSEDQGGYWYESRDFSQAEHSGTHLDAPAHFSEGKWRVDQIPVSRLIGPGVKVDMTLKVREFGLDSVLQLEDLESWENQHGLIPHGCIITGQHILGTPWILRFRRKIQKISTSLA